MHACMLTPSYTRQPPKIADKKIDECVREKKKGEGGDYEGKKAWQSTGTTQEVIFLFKYFVVFCGS